MNAREGQPTPINRGCSYGVLYLHNLLRRSTKFVRRPKCRAYTTCPICECVKPPKSNKMLKVPVTDAPGMNPTLVIAIDTTDLSMKSLHLNNFREF